MNDRTRELECVIEDPKQQVRDVEKERDALRSKNHQYEVRLRKILEEPENTMSNGKAMREMLRQAWVIDSLGLALNAAAHERDELRARIEEMERQEPVEWQSRSRPSWGAHQWGNWESCSPGYAQDITKSPTLHDWQYEARPLYTLPGAKGE